LKDLEIRGAGSILGEVQSGHIAAVGFDLYAELVAEAVSKLEGQMPAETEIKEVRIELPVDAHLPDAYLPDQSLRLEAYRRLAAAETPEAVEEAKAEWIDRFGPLPPEAEALIEIALLRVEALRVGLTEIVNLRHEVRLAPVGLSASEEIRLERLAPKGVVRDAVMFVPLPRGNPVTGMIDFVRRMWPPG
jgi:transcription-repair coupling factor (superfamily II helicase)